MDDFEAVIFFVNIFFITKSSSNNFSSIGYLLACLHNNNQYSVSFASFSAILNL
jgi:hypothetical protein